MSDWIQRLEDALQQAEPYRAARALAVECRDGGTPRQELLEIFEKVRDKLGSCPNGVAYDTVLDVMDCITGWCAPHNRLYSE